MTEIFCFSGRFSNVGAFSTTVVCLGLSFPFDVNEAEHEDTSVFIPPEACGLTGHVYTCPLYSPRNARSPNQVAAHREPLLDLTLRSIRFPDLGLARAGASCLRAVLRGSSTDGGGKTAVGAGGRTVEIAGAVEALLRVMSSPRLVHYTPYMIAALC